MAFIEKDSTETDNDDSKHPIFTTDPEMWMKLVHSKVKVTTTDDAEHIGWVYTVDPVSESIVLVTMPGEDDIHPSRIAVSILVGSSVVGIDPISDPSEKIQKIFNRLFRPASMHSLTEDELEARKVRVKMWLEKNRLPVTIGADDMSLTISGALVINPPYTEESCLSTNEIILSRIRGLLKNMPQD